MEKCRFEDDSSLIRSCVERDESAWDFFIKKYSGLILSSIACRMRKYGFYPQADDLQEIRQQILSVLWEGGKLSEVKNPSSLKYWLSVVSGNIAVEFLRKRRRAHEIAPVSLSDIVEGIDMSDLLPSAAADPAREADRTALSEKLEDAIESLPPNEKLAIKLNLLHGKKHEEIACIMAIPRATATSHVRRARLKLKKLLRDYR
jgi:RNA polymerase sigma-70 factor (ECF subfamily)